LSMSIGGSFGNRLMSLKESLEESLVIEGERLDEENCPTNPSKWSYYKSQAKKKFDVYPSAYANGWASKQYKAAGGGWKSCKKESIDEKMVSPQRGHNYYQLYRDTPIKYISGRSGIGLEVPGVLLHNEYDTIKGKKGAYIIDYFGQHFYVDIKNKFASKIANPRDSEQNKDLIKNMGRTALAPEHSDWKKYMNESVNEVDASDIEIGDFIHLKSKNKTGMVLKISGNKVTINTPKGKITGDLKDVQLLHQDNVNEAASRTAMEIGGLTGMNKDAIQKFVDDNNLDIEKVYQFVKKGKLADRMKLVSAIAGKPNNPVQKKMVKQFGESVNESVEGMSKQQLDRVARGMFGKSYSRLTMDQAAKLKFYLNQSKKESVIKEAAKLKLGKDSVSFKVMGDKGGLTILPTTGNDLDKVQDAIENDIDVKEELRKSLEKQLKIPVEIERGYEGGGFRFIIDFYSLAKQVK